MRTMLFQAYTAMMLSWAPNLGAASRAISSPASADTTENKILRQLIDHVQSRSLVTPITDTAPFQSAVDLWLSDSAAANETYGDIASWDTSSVTTLSPTFLGASSFNQDIGAWDTSRVTDLSYTFEFTHAFNQDIGAWDTSRVTDLSYTFSGAYSFIQYIGACLDTHDVIVTGKYIFDSYNFKISCFM